MPRTFRFLVPSARRKNDTARPGRAKGDLSEARVSQGMAWTQGFRSGLEMHLESLFGLSGVLSWLSLVDRCEAAGVVLVVW